MTAMLAVVSLLLAVVTTAGPMAQPAPPAPKGTPVTKHAAGTFDVKILPQKDEGIGDALISRMTIDKQYHGDLVGTGLGQMLAGMGEMKDSGAYVAIERVKGTVHGRTGSFAVHHVGVMDRGAQHLVITVIPDSGTGELAGITGTMTIEIKGGAHYYTLDYALPQ
jgi:hypothetical protein